MRLIDADRIKGAINELKRIAISEKEKMLISLIMQMVDLTPTANIPSEQQRWRDGE